MDAGIIAIWIIFIIFGSLSAPFSIWQIGKILKDRRQDKLRELDSKHRRQLEEMRIHAELDSKILGPGIVGENITAEMQSLREEIRQIKEELNRLKAGMDNYIR